MELLQTGSDALLTMTGTSASILAIQAGTQLYQSFIVRCLATATSESGFASLRKDVLSESRHFLSAVTKSRAEIAKLGAHFIRDEMTILMHGSSRCVTALLVYAATQLKIHFRVYITQSRPDSLSQKLTVLLRKAGIPTCILLDSAIGFALPKCDIVFVGAECVCENGGVVGGVGTYQVALMSKIAHRSLYVVTEACKFVRYTPLDQYDVPQRTALVFSTALEAEQNDGAVERNNPKVDYTPPEYVTGLITDIGMLPPSGVSEELLRRQ